MPPWKHGTKREHQIGLNSTISSTSSPFIMYRRNNNSRISERLSDTCLADNRLRWVVVLVTLMTMLSTAEAICDPERWWDPVQTDCVPCTVCGEQQLVLRPCQEYMDTVCGTMKDLDMDLGQLARAENHHEQRHWNEDRRHHRPDHLHGQSHAAGSHTAQHQVSSKQRENTEEIMWDWQAASLLLAIIGCLLFFFAAAIIALNQTRQWRRIEKHFDADMEALSAQLMNHLSSMQQLENGSIFLDDVISSQSVDEQRRFRSGAGLLGGHHQHHRHHHHPIEVRCVYLDQLLDDKHTVQRQGPGNLYIEENNDRLSPIGAGNGTVASGTTTRHHHNHQLQTRMY
ncbi:tumor necrosis factor receptor superfamily member wengen [Wyeomyia smithii]|uniref:tumor necrosis factor receptor superfamily member wengen n=1 Tax=Wyeomyia smithii TaxID=174621 RepID=UPI002467C5F5|nr:tumor necrosis factor receptor superfamily member wengen [Wyeomyia smithii]